MPDVPKLAIPFETRPPAYSPVVVVDTLLAALARRDDLLGLFHPADGAIADLTGNYGPAAPAGAGAVTDDELVPAEPGALVDGYAAGGERDGAARFVDGVEDTDGLLALFAPDPDGGTVVDRTGNYTATLQNGAAVTADEVVPSEPGAISCDEANDYVATSASTRRNLCTNPRAAVDTTGWAATTSGSFNSGGTLSRVTGVTAPIGDEALQLACPGSGNPYQGFWQNMSVSSGVTYKVSFYARITSGSSTNLYVIADSATGADLRFDSCGANWTRFSFTWNSAVTTLRLGFRHDGSATTACTFQITGVLVEPTSTLGDYFDGSGHVASGTWVPATDTFRTDLGDTAWTGIAHASTSTRAGRTNLCTNPSFETDAAGWVAAAAGVNTLSRDTGTSKFGSASLKSVGDGAAVDQGMVTVPSMTATPSTAHTFSVWAKGAAGGETLELRIYERTAADAYVSETTQAITLTTSWQRYSVSRTFGATGAKARVGVMEPGAVANTFYIDGALFETGSSVNSYFDGSGTQENQSLTGWLGLEHASASDYGVFANGTTRTFVTPTQTSVTGAVQAVAGGTLLGVYFDTVGSMGFSADNTLFSVTASPQNTGASALFAWTFEEPANTVTYHKNGAFVEVDAHTAQWAAQTLQIGRDAGGVYPFDGLIGPVAIFDRALTAAQHAAFAALLSGEVFKNGEARTYGGIARRQNQSAAHTLLGGSPASNATQIKLASGSGNVLLVLAGTTYTFTAAWPGDGAQHFWTLVVDEPANTASLYVDGALVEAKTGVTAQHAAAQGFRFGAHGSGSDPFDGTLWPGFVVDGAMSAGDVAALAVLAAAAATTGGDLIQPAMLATVEQDSESEVAACVYAALATEPEQRIELPEYGLADQAFRENGVDFDELRRVVEEWEPRADIFADDEFDGIVQKVQVSTQ